MTVDHQLRKTLAELRGAKANLQSFSIRTTDQKAKQILENAAVQAQTLADALENRIRVLEEEEPQYRQ